MLQNKISILSTKILQPSMIDEAAKKNIEIDHFSFIKIIQSVDEVIAEQTKNLASQKVTVVFTSSNAVEAVVHQLKQNNIQPKWKVFCLSGITKTSIENYFSHVFIEATATNSKDLAEKIIQHKTQSVVFFCGNIRREDLPNKLKQNNIAVSEIKVYETLKTPHSIHKNYNGVLFFSPSAAESFFSINKIESSTVLFAIGETTANEIKKHCSNKIIVTDYTNKENVAVKAITYFEQIKTKA